MYIFRRCWCLRMNSKFIIAPQPLKQPGLFLIVRELWQKVKCSYMSSSLSKTTSTLLMQMPSLQIPRSKTKHDKTISQGTHTTPICTLFTLRKNPCHPTKSRVIPKDQKACRLGHKSRNSLKRLYLDPQILLVHANAIKPKGYVTCGRKTAHGLGVSSYVKNSSWCGHL